MQYIPSIPTLYPGDTESSPFPSGGAFYAPQGILCPIGYRMEWIGYIAYWPLIVLFLLKMVVWKCFWSPGENRKGPIKSGLCVRRVSVCLCVTDYLRNRSEDFSDTWHEVGGKKCKKHSMAAFLKFDLMYSLFIGFHF
jgi:hypothetical protein